MEELYKIFLLGIAFGFAGFIIETINNSVKNGRYVYSGDKYFWGIPFLPIYSIGGLLMEGAMNSLQGFPWLVILIVAWLEVCLWEYLAGLYCDKKIGRKFWDYSKEKYNVNGYVSLRSASWWFVFSAIYYVFLFGHVQSLLGFV